jgi:hypothetical protein
MTARLPTCQRDLLRFATALGFDLRRTNGGHVKAVLGGKAVIFGSTPSDWRGSLNAGAQLRRTAAGRVAL